VIEADLAGRLRAWLDAAVGDPASQAVDGSAIAIGWATVDLGRAAADLGAALGLPPEAFVAAASTASLGGRCRVRADALRAGLALVLLEPETEGRLAATLARHDEGPAAVWLAVADPTVAAEALRGAGVAIGEEQPGPFGPERILGTGLTAVPHRLLVRTPGTIRP
jgi:hypothetical protein